MPKYTDEQIERAKNADVRSFLEQTEGYSFEGRGRFLKCRNSIHTQQPSSLSIDTHLNRIFYNSVTGNRPLSAIDWCTKIKDMDFQTAMKYVLEEEPQGARAERPKFQQHRSQPEISAPKNLELSEKSDTSKHVYSYLTITRGIPENIVNDCLNKNLIYEDVRNNAVFVGYDSSGNTPKYAARRGTFTPDGKDPFKRDCTGSDKNFAFRLEGKSTETIYVAEAAIDVLSLAALEDKFNGSGAYKEKTYLSTGGAGIDNALEQFCKTHDVKTINICFDDDEAGKNGMEKIMQKFRERGYIVNDMRASMAHDYNDELVAFNNNPNFYENAPKVVQSSLNDTYEKGIEHLTQERNDIMPEKNISQEESNQVQQSEQQEMQGLYSIEQNGELQYYKTDKTANELLQISANSENPYAEMMNHGERISEIEYTEIQQSSVFKFSVDINFDNNNASIFAVNMGRGGIPESERNPENVYFQTARLSDYVKENPERLVQPQKEQEVQPNQPEMQGLFSVEQNGEVMYRKTDMTAKELLNISANSDKPYLNMSAIGERISQEEYAQIQQSANFKFSVDINLNDKSASVFAVNMGRGGIPESERNPENVYLQKVQLSDYVKKAPEKSVPDKPRESHLHQAQPVQPKPQEKANISSTSEQPKKEQEVQTAKSSEKAVEQANPEEKMNKLLCFAKDNQESKRAELLDKIGEIDSKIADGQERVEKLNNKIADLESSLKTLAAFKRTFGNTLFGKLIDSRIENKQAKIKKIREIKIPKQQDKIKVQNDKKSKAVAKLSKVNKKIEKIDKVQDFLSALGSKDREKRHEGFVSGLESLSDIRRENLENKLHKAEAKIDMLSAKYSSPENTHTQRYEIGKSIHALNAKVADISDKIEKLNKLNSDLEDIKNGKFTENEIENAVIKTADKISERFENPDSNSEKGVINTVISHSVESGREAVSEVASEKEREQAEKSAPNMERERTPEEKQPDVTENTEQKIINAVATVTGIDVSEISRLPADIKADIISEFQENNGNIPTEQLTKRICEIADIEPPKDIKAQEQPLQAEERREKEKSLNEIMESQKKSSVSIDDGQSKDTPLFSRSKIMSEDFKPVSEQSQEDKNIKKDHNIGI